MRGHGTLALTEDELIFAQWIPSEPDSIALWVRDLDAWLAALGAE